MTILIAPDSFKGTLTAREVCDIVGQAFRCVYPDSEICSFPLADGGEGMVAAWHAACGGQLRDISVFGPFGCTPVHTEYLLLPDGTAVAELASCAGLELVEPEHRNPERTTTRGLGTFVVNAFYAGAKRVLLGLGGSATNDAGCGMASYLGCKFLDKHGHAFWPTGGTLCEVTQFLPSKKPFLLPITAACDVQNPLYGPDGAAYVYAPQKGADEAMVQRLDKGLRHIASLFPAELANTPGAGAAGGAGFGVMAFLGGDLRPGIDLLLDQSNFTQMLSKADLVITGEGRMDAQTLRGKAPYGVMRRAVAAGVPVIGICGCLGEGADKLLDAGFAGLYPASADDKSMEELRKTCREDLYRAAAAAGKAFRFTGKT